MPIRMIRSKHLLTSNSPGVYAQVQMRQHCFPDYESNVLSTQSEPISLWNTTRTWW